MEFHEFVQKLKKYCNLYNAEFMVEVLQNIAFKEFELPLDNTLSKIYKGNASPCGIAKKLNGNMDSDKFKQFLEDTFCDQIEYLVNEFNIPEININNWSDKITELFVVIIDDLNKLDAPALNSKNVLSGIPNVALDANETDINTADDIIKVNLTKSIKTLESIQTIKMPDELIPYYEFKYEYINDNCYSNIVAKNKEALVKYPPNSIVTIDISNFSKEEKQKRINLGELVEDANVNNYPMLFGKTLKKEDFFGSIPSPLNNNIKDSVFFIDPKPTNELPFRFFSFQIYNDFINLDFKHIKMLILGFHDKGTTVSNERIANYEIFSFKMRKRKNNFIDFTFKFDFKDEFKNDVQANLDLYKWSILRQDKNSYLKLSIDEPYKILVNQKNSGVSVFRKKDKKNILNIIEYFNKLIYIQNTLGLKFNVSDNIFFKELISIDIVYNFLRKKQKTYNCKLIFDFCDYIEGLPLSGQSINNYKFPLRQVKLFGETIALKNTFVIIDEAQIYPKEEEKSKKCILVTQKSVIVSK